MSAKIYYVGVDVGTSSVRAALVTQNGKVISMSNHSIDILEPDLDFYEQSSDNIWSGCCQAIKDVTANVDKSQIRGVGFDATCSLVVLDQKQEPLSISPSGDNHWNIMMWMDHRALKQANRINQTNHPVLRYVGGNISLEMQTPKLLWLKETMRTQCWDKAGHFFDLPDFLTWKATGSFVRSQCCLGCKWTYHVDSEQDKTGWDDGYFTQIGLEDLVTTGYKQIGTDVQSPGCLCGEGLGERAAAEMGLLVGTPVATSIIDAHAGGLGCLGCSCDDLEIDMTLTSRLALICGTSSCHMAVCGLTLSSGVEDLAVQYLATVQALAYGTQHILTSLTQAGHGVQSICICGGLAKNKVFVQAHANATGLPVLLPQTTESVLLGAAILGACASGDFSSIQDAMATMSGMADVVRPEPEVKGYHKKKQAVFHKMVSDQLAYKELMERDC